MPSERKLQLKDPQSIEEILRASFQLIEELQIADTYYMTSQGEVCKCREIVGKPPKVVHFKPKNDGGFQTIPYPSGDDIFSLKKQLAEELGIDCVLQKSVRRYSNESLIVSVHEFKDHNLQPTHSYLVIEHGDSDALCRLLNLNQREFFSTPFNELEALRGVENIAVASES